MSVRVLVIDDEEVYRRLLSQHVAVGFESPVTADYDPGRQGRLPTEFHGSGYDAVLLDESPGVGTGLEWLRDLTHRNEFPPVIYMLVDLTPEAEREAKEAGAFACLSKRKIDNRALVKTLRSAQAARRRRAAPMTSTDEAERICRFGDLIIRGYKFVRKLSENPVSSVFLAQRLTTGDQVVLKVLRQAPDASSRGADTFDRFLREYQIAAGIRHPNIVRIFDFGADDDHAYIAMEYFPDGDLRQRIREGIPPGDSLRLLRQMAEALEVLHRSGVLHRDLKPGNVMLREDGSLVLIDFGMSKQLELDASITASGQIFGTPYYMSPEQGHGRDTDERGDIYSLGVIFYEMLMRRKPYVAGTPMQIIYKHANAPLPELPSELRRFEPLLLGCMAKDPARRYPSARALVAAIKEMEREEAEREAVAS